MFFSVTLKDISLLSPKGHPRWHMIQLSGWLGILGTIVVLCNALRLLACTGEMVGAPRGGTRSSRWRAGECFIEFHNKLTSAE
jgi:hypothetical protein